MKFILVTGAFLGLSSVLVGAFLLAFLWLPAAAQRGTVEIRIERGEPLSAVGEQLKQKAVISNQRLFILWSRMLAVEKKIHWGRYRFELPLSPGAVLDQMVLGTGAFRRITVAEGLTVKEIAGLLESAGIARGDRFLNEARRPELLSLLGLEGNGIEGHLFPDTYFFTPHTTEREILIAMTDQFRHNFTRAMQEELRQLGWSLHQLITLASLIEKETGDEAERVLVSAVFHNRLKRKIPLQSDPSVVYGLKRFSGQLTRQDLQSPSPYNTYRIQGLPPGPICNPGLASLVAALYPAEVPYLYFVSKNDGSHLFSVTLAEHNRAVEKYQSKKRNHSRP
ncbi:MAG: endolytic transglycosylase MltG [Deltaproteobacteria bacterium]|nr:endolytic transglycosylase MltG [Deltaproteobacteria bacterium]